MPRGAKVVYELEHFGMPFDRNPDGTIYQRPSAAMTANYGRSPCSACAAADRTGHAMLHTCTSRTSVGTGSSSDGWRST